MPLIRVTLPPSLTLIYLSNTYYVHKHSWINNPELGWQIFQRTETWCLPDCLTSIHPREVHSTSILFFRHTYLLDIHTFTSNALSCLDNQLFYYNLCLKLCEAVQAWAQLLCCSVIVETVNYSKQYGFSLYIRPRMFSLGCTSSVLFKYVKTTLYPQDLNIFHAT